MEVSGGTHFFSMGKVGGGGEGQRSPATRSGTRPVWLGRATCLLGQAPLAAWALCQHPLRRADEGESQRALGTQAGSLKAATGPVIAPEGCPGRAGEKRAGAGGSACARWGAGSGGSAAASWVRGLVVGKGAGTRLRVGAELLGKGAEWGPLRPPGLTPVPGRDQGPGSEAGATAWGAGGRGLRGSLPRGLCFPPTHTFQGL